MKTLEAIEFALKSLSIKRQTEHEMREKIRNRFPNADLDTVITRLKELDYLDDQSFASAFIRHRSLSSPRGSYALRQELKRKGVSEADMESALSHFEDEEEAVIESLARKKWAQIREANAFKKRQKLQRFLLSRGFAVSSVLEAVNSVANGQEDC
ncbi:MAG: regulatory protein RecX [bacterium]|nr:regulatory protein RecX [bacterium]